MALPTRAVRINFPLQNAELLKPPVFLQRAGPDNAPFRVPANFGYLGGPANGVPVILPFRINPEKLTPPSNSLGLAYMPGTERRWLGTYLAWNSSQYDRVPVEPSCVATGRSQPMGAL